MSGNAKDAARIVVALDYAEARDALELAAKLDPQRCRVKVGKELFTRAGPALVEQLMQRGFDVFLDLKFHDIPTTVAKACAAAADLGVWMVNVHALGGRRMMAAAREAIAACAHQPILIAVTVLTSMGEEDLRELGLTVSPQEQALKLAALARAAGMDGVVCSAQEVRSLHAVWPAACLVTPGIRPAWSQPGDQVRVMTPRQAMAAGSSYLVIGRPITAAADPLQALARIEEELKEPLI
ncbi:MAG: orotidine-5'-phosphate decarboxylase [Pseudomonadota bacterium]